MEFSKIHAAAQEIFDRQPIPAFISQIKSLLIFDEPIVPPSSQPPKARTQSKSLPPGDPAKIVAERENCTEHILQAMHKIISDKNPWEVEAPELCHAVQFVASAFSNPSALIQARKEVIGTLRKMSAELKQHNSLLKELMPATVRTLNNAVPIDICMLYVLSRAIGSPDSNLPHEFVSGFSMFGDIPPSNVFIPKLKVRTSFKSTFEFHKSNTRLIGSIRNRANKYNSPVDIENAKECYAKTVQEVELGLMDGPFDLNGIEEKIQTKPCAARRFPQFRYPGAPARPCDNFSENEVNDMHTLHESIVTENSDYPQRVAELYFSLLPGLTGFKLSTNDLRKAYRQIPSGHPEMCVVAIWNPHLRKVEFFLVYGLPFGAALSVNQFNRPMELLQSVLRRLFAIPAAHYFDDWAIPSPSFIAKSDDETLQQLHKVLGFDLDEGKHESASITPFLGVQYDFTQFKQGLVIVSIKPDRIVKLQSLLHSVHCKQSLSSSVASTLHGKLYFATTQCFGRVGRAALQPIIKAQYSHAPSWSPDIAASIEFFQALLLHNPKRTLQLYPDLRRHLIIWSDASWENDAGMLGVVVYDPIPNRFFYTSMAVPAWMRARWVPKAQKIGQAEILAMILPYLSLPASVIKNRNVIHFADNTSAIAAMIKGYSAAPDSAFMVNIFHTFNTYLKSNTWYEHVDSKANPSDFPSRGMFEYVRTYLQAEWFEPILDEWMWLRPAYAWFYAPYPNP